MEVPNIRGYINTFQSCGLFLDFPLKSCNSLVDSTETATFQQRKFRAAHLPWSQERTFLLRRRLAAPEGPSGNPSAQPAEASPRGHGALQPRDGGFSLQVAWPKKGTCHPRKPPDLWSRYLGTKMFVVVTKICAAFTPKNHDLCFSPAGTNVCAYCCWNPDLCCFISDIETVPRFSFGNKDLKLTLTCPKDLEATVDCFWDLDIIRRSRVWPGTNIVSQTARCTSGKVVPIFVEGVPNRVCLRG